MMIRRVLVTRKCLRGEGGAPENNPFVVLAAQKGVEFLSSGKVVVYI
jgi:hypothetical protein